MTPARKARTSIMKPRAVTPERYAYAQIRGQVVRLNQMPMPLPPDAVLCYLGRESSGRAVILCPVNKLNSLPDSLSIRVQGLIPGCESNCELPVIVAPNGKIYVVIDRMSRGH